MLAAGRSSISAHRRSLMTATAAGAVLCALWFVPSAKATPDAPGGSRHAATSSQVPAPESGSAPGAAPGQGAGSSSTAAGTAAAPPASSRDGFTAPFVLSALGLAGTGGVLIVRARRRAAGAGTSGRSAQASSPVTD